MRLNEALEAADAILAQEPLPQNARATIDALYTAADDEDGQREFEFEAIYEALLVAETSSAA